MRAAGRVAAAARRIAGSLAQPGTKTADIDREVREFIRSRGGEPTFLGYNGFPKSVCVSVNDEVIHGIPGSRRLRPGDIVSVDVGVTLNGYVGDCAATFAVGDVSDEARRLIEVTELAFGRGAAHAVAGGRVSDVSRAVQEYAESAGFSVVRRYVGHGVGETLHEPPEVPNFVESPRRGPDPRLVAGMTLAVEPMVNAGGADVRVLADGWTVLTADGSLSAHYENTILVTNGEPEILTVE